MKHRSTHVFLALLAAFALIAAACGDDDDDSTGGTDGGNGAVEPVDFKACEVTDTGGVDDNSFNETAYNGLVRAQDELGVEIEVLESQSASDFEPNITTLMEQDCDIIVTVGFLLGDATLAAAQDNEDQQFAIVDFDFFDLDAGEDVTLDNVRELTFSTDQAAFLAGYAAAGMTETGTVGTYGGINIPTVSIFMKGFEAGIEHYNEQNNADVELVGWSTADDDGLFTGDFEDQTKGRDTTDTLLDEGADIIMPVAGPVGLGTIEAIRASGTDAKVIWVDTDGCVSVANECDLFLTSVMKNMDVAVFDTIAAAVDDAFEGGLYVGTLDNNGVQIADFHDFDADVPDDLKTELDDLRQQIIDGDIETQLG